MFGWAGKVLAVDLSEGSWESKSLPEQFYQQWLGGPGLNIALHTGKMAGWEKLAGDAVAIASGALVGSPLMGANTWSAAGPNSSEPGLAIAYGTGNWGAYLKFTGWDQVILKRTAIKPSYIVINENGCRLERIQEPIEDAGAIANFIKKKLGDAEAAILVFTFQGIVSDRGLVFEDQIAIGSLLAKRNLRAIAVQKQGSVNLADPETVLHEARNAVQRWLITGMKWGYSGCLACHGSCRQRHKAVTCEENDEVASSLWLAAGICPQLIASGASPWAAADLEKLICAVTGWQCSREQLWKIAHNIHNANKVLSEKLGGWFGK
ncbi:aldehyde ferredoxin oxidoreductase N-terminal domain-containing protein [Neomoorella humiferrea]|uniref:aldehyde ferredoxin oxidoreductase N-terminal domain-containing protein n=1 Tax=Neomoorella humiferrea TaxID=676965 RepID=UPI003D8C6C17